MIGTSDQSCWLAEACKILLLLLHQSQLLLPSDDPSLCPDERFALALQHTPGYWLVQIAVLVDFQAHKRLRTC